MFRGTHEHRSAWGFSADVPRTLHPKATAYKRISWTFTLPVPCKVVEAAHVEDAISADSVAEPLLLTVAAMPIGGGALQSISFRLPFTLTGCSSSIDWYAMATPLRIYAAGGGTGGSVLVSGFFDFTNSGRGLSDFGRHASKRRRGRRRDLPD
jgi:hypothetical protein